MPGYFPVFKIASCCLLILLAAACKENAEAPTVESINALNLKRGDIIACGPPDQQFGTVGFVTACSPEVKKDFELGVALLHSFEYDESEKTFAKVIDAQPSCAMAYWGVAMSNYHTLWAPPTPAELTKGSKAIDIALSIPSKSKREAEYISAAATFYKDWKTTDHATRFKRFEAAMEQLYKNNPEDREAAVFYALILTAAAEPTDKSFAKQKKAAAILEALYVQQPDHPGIIHYIIHSYDYPQLAGLALDEARKYARIAPSSAHAQHMPSHIFTRLGIWSEDISSNKAAAASAKCYAETNGIKGHWDEELHAIDYLVYAYLQQGDNNAAREQLKYVGSMQAVSPVNFKVSYAFAAIPARYMLENRLWKQAAALQLSTGIVDWKQYPWQAAIHHYAKALGFSHIGQLDSAKIELQTLTRLREQLLTQKDAYKANQVNIQIKAADAWIQLQSGKADAALALMRESADMEDKTQKHSVTPGEVLPARELLGDMLIELKKPREALVAYESSLIEHPNRFNGLYGAGRAAALSNEDALKDKYLHALLKIASASSERPEMAEAERLLGESKIAGGH